MGYVKEPKNVDLVVGPSVLTEATKNKIAHAIEEYRKTGKNPINVEVLQQGLAKTATNIGRTRSTAVKPDNVVKRKENA